MAGDDSVQQSGVAAAPQGEKTQAGKRYACETCGSEVLVTRANAGGLTCCGAAMAKK